MPRWIEKRCGGGSAKRWRWHSDDGGRRGEGQREEEASASERMELASCFSIGQEKRATSRARGAMVRYGGHVVLGFCTRSATADLKTEAHQSSMKVTDGATLSDQSS
jgi:hypothetical protein